MIDWLAGSDTVRMAGSTLRSIRVIGGQGFRHNHNGRRGSARSWRRGDGRIDLNLRRTFGQGGDGSLFITGEKIQSYQQAHG